MSYLIDGNNLMGGSGSRRELLADLAEFAALKKVRVAVVFDGAPEANFPDGAAFRGVKIYYSARGSNADARIKRIVETSKERRTLLVVTDDRALADYVRRSGAKIVNCREFWHRMANLPPQKTQKQNEGVRPEELSDWMRYFGVDESEEGE